MTLEFLQNTNPLLLVVLLSLIYTLFYLIKKDIRQFALFTGTLLLLALIFSPGGQAIADKTRYLDSPEARAKCLVFSLGAGGLWKEEASKEKWCQN